MFLMQARSSVSLAMVTWVTATPDWTGVDFPGPGVPENVSATFQPGAGGSGGQATSTFTLSGTSADLAAGDAFCSANDTSDPNKVTKAVSAALAVAKGIIGLVADAVNAGDTFEWTADPIARSASGLGDGDGTWVAVNSSARPVRVPKRDGGEAIAGYCDGKGNIVQAPEPITDTSPVHTFNPKSFGCPCDRVHDDLPGLIAMLAAMPSTGGRIDIPFGNLMYCSDDLHITKPVKLSGRGGGNGWEQSGFEFAPGKGLIFDNNDTSSDGNNAAQFTCQDLDVRSKTLYRTGYLSKGITKVFSNGAFVRAGDCYKRSGHNDDRYFRALNEGTFGSSEPAWSDTPNSTLVDHGITWRTEGFPRNYVTSHAYVVGERFWAPNDNRYYFQISHAGTSGGVAFPVNAVGQQVIGGELGDDPTWTPSTTIALNDHRAPTRLVLNGHRYKATSIGSAPHHTGSSEPTWPTGAGATVTDGDITWTEDGAQLQFVCKLNPAILVNTDLGLIHKVDIQGFTGAGIHAQGGTAGHVDGNTTVDNMAMRDIVCDFTGIGIYVGGSDGNGYTIDRLFTIGIGAFTGAEISENGIGGHGFQEHASGGGEIRSLYAQLSSGRAIYKDGSGHLVMLSCSQELSLNCVLTGGSNEIFGGTIAVDKALSQSVIDHRIDGYGRREIDDTGGTSIIASLTSGDGITAHFVGTGDDGSLGWGWRYQYSPGWAGTAGTGWTGLSFGTQNQSTPFGVSNTKAAEGPGHWRDYFGHFVGSEALGARFRGELLSAITNKHIRGGHHLDGDRFCWYDSANGIENEYEVLTSGYRGTPWVANTGYLGVVSGVYNFVSWGVFADIVEPTANETPTPASSRAVFRCTTGGTSGNSEPTWDTTPGHTTADGTAVWTCLANVPVYAGKRTLRKKTTTSATTANQVLATFPLNDKTLNDFEIRVRGHETADFTSGSCVNIDGSFTRSGSTVTTLDSQIGTPRDTGSLNGTTFDLNVSTTNVQVRCTPATADATTWDIEIVCRESRS